MAAHRGRDALITTVIAAATALLVGCKTVPNQAPVEDRAAGHATASRPAAEPPRAAAAVAAQPVPAPAAAETRAATYTVKPGDTLMRIALDAGQSWKDLARWNSIDNPNLIEVGQVLRILPPPGEAVAAARPVVPARPPASASVAVGASGASGASGAASAVAAAPSPAPAPVIARGDSDDDLQWAWPAAGAVTAPFDDTRSKGLGIGGKLGDPVLAAADGRVVYAGAGLRGLGNLVIVKHNANYLTAYAHNQTLLVKEDQVVKRGQKIAEMGATDTDKVQLHFEIRKQGKPIDPTRLLPPR